MKKILVCLLVIIMIFVGCQPVPASSDAASLEECSSEESSSKPVADDGLYNEPLVDGYIGFIKADGTKLFDESGKEYYIQGMAFGNCVFNNPALPPLHHHSEENYKELAELGFNSVRFYLNYGLFEDDKSPYQYKDTGFGWLDKNIKWAKKHGIRLVLNMHFPQGGYQSSGGGHALWTDPENMKRLTALWTEIAKRYADEPTILGFGLINEPGISVEKTEDAMPMYTKIVQDMVDEIRKVNKNHIIFVEKVAFVQDSATLERYWPTLNDRCNWPEIQDGNLVYEFHTYDPHTFTHQGDPDNLVYYPDTSKIEHSVVGEVIKDTIGDRADYSNNDWQTLETSPVVCTGENQIIRFFLETSYIGVGGKVFIDDVVIKEFDENQNFVRNIYSSSFSEITTMYFWSETSNKTTGYSTTHGVNSGGCIWVGDIDRYGDGVSYSFVGKPNYSYCASIAIRVEKVLPTTTVRPRLRLCVADEVLVSDREFLESTFVDEINFSKEHNAVIYCGEFGVNNNCFSENGGEVWVGDMLDILKETGIHFNYHAFHENLFGLYTNFAGQPPADLNQKLYDVFVEKLAEK